jgi:hypothetical protein
MAYDGVMDGSLAPLELFYSGLTPNRAVIHARLSGGQELAGLSLAGIVRGPRCSRGSTLPATYPLVGQVSNLSKKESGQVENRSYASAEALITEPIFWSPDWPALYDVTVDLRQEGKVVEQAKRTIGLRPLAVVGKNLAYGGKTWVVRGIRCKPLLEVEIGNCRGSHAAIFAPAEGLDERLMTMASEEGTLVMAELSQANAAAEVSRLSRYAAVAIAVLPPASGPIRASAATNIALAHRLKQGEVEPPPDDARLVLAEVTKEASFADWAKTLARPIIAYRPLPAPYEIAAARAECDRLQRDLAPYGQFAGYIV